MKKVKKIKLVRQIHAYGCKVACIAMISGEPYDVIEKRFVNNFHKQGISDDIFFEYLSNFGFSILLKETRFFNSNDFGNEELLTPFKGAAFNLVEIKKKIDSCSHWVVMNKKGKLFCPLGWTEEEIKEAYYINRTLGLFREKKNG